MITQITKKVALCEATEVTEEVLKKLEIQCVFNINEVENPWERDGLPNEKELCEKLGITYLWFPCPGDGKTMTAYKERLFAASVVLGDLCKHYNRIILHCLNSIDRAPFVLATYIANAADLTLPQAYSVVKQQRKWVMEHYEWVLQ